MKLLRTGESGHETPCFIDREGAVRDASAVVEDWDETTLQTERLAETITRLNTECDRFPLTPSDIRVGPPIARARNLLCVGLNYRDHAVETGAEAPEEPIVFSKAPSSLTGPFDPVLIPPASQATDWEVELAVVIGRRARYLDSPEDAGACITGYCTVNDLSERHWQLERHGQWIKGKSFETFNPLGPYLVTADEVVDPQNLRLTCRVDGEVVQSGSTADMIFGVHYLVWYLTQFMVLEPGDMINTGTPAGVGLSTVPPRFLRPGSLVEVEVEGLGAQRSRCVQGARAHDPNHSTAARL